MLGRILIFLILLLSAKASSQDIHFTQFDKNPQMLNPSLTGNYTGDWRYVFNQRSQWRSVSRSYNTFAVSAENKQELILPNLYHGVNYLNDVAGDGDFRTHELNISNAYLIYLSEDSSQSIVPSIQVGINYKNIDFNAFNYDSQFNGYQFVGSLPSNEIFINQSYANINLAFGVGYFANFKNKARLESGISIFNIIDKTETFMGNTSIKRNRRLSVHGKFIYPINQKWDALPGLLYQRQGTYQELIFGSNFRHIHRNQGRDYIAPYIGAWFRNKDAINAVAGLYYNNWVGGLSYDVNISQLSPASNIRGGLEFSLQYIVNIFKPKDIQYRVCPDYL